ncbi:hypothetical protein VitviT2T_019937 [Vitis vinifera]|uniref:Reverse transcriptase Ty1/copia-type domain-containing protein n=1 Tax=Vitis vinifera TaxID=29760 RepID=A0ABY9D4J3_VITVI|nr:hypothetical protein VitviT2T_019937 [Vitis vinifera]
MRCLLALATTRGWSLHQMDVNNVFLHDDLHEEIYMSPPPGLQRQGEENLVCRLHKSLYGLKQASRQWFAKFSEAIQSVGYAQSRADYSLFTRKQGKSFIAILIYVDDILITGNDPFMHQSRKAHMEAKLRVVRYLKNAHGQGLFFSSNNDFKLRAYCDSDWAVSLSSAEAEYRAMTGACCELTWLRYLLRDLGVLHQEPALLYCDNKAALHIIANPVFHKQTRNIEMDCHNIRDKIQDGSIITRHVSSTHQLADILTKPLGKKIFAPMIHKLGVQDIRSPT